MPERINFQKTKGKLNAYVNITAHFLDLSAAHSLGDFRQIVADIVKIGNDVLGKTNTLVLHRRRLNDFRLY